MAVIFWLLAISLAATYIGLRDRVWWALAIAAACSFVPGIGAHVPFMGLLLMPFLQLAMALALRWRVGVAGWLGLLLAGTAVWFFGAALQILVRGDVPLVWVLPIGLFAGIVGLVWNRAPRLLRSR